MIRARKKPAPDVVLVDLVPEDRADLLAGLALAVEVTDSVLNAWQSQYAGRQLVHLADPALPVNDKQLIIVRHLVAVVRGEK